jgi:hypothetical protein
MQTFLRLLSKLRGDAGASLVEFTMMSPFLIVLLLGLVELSYALVDQHVVTRVAREGSNLISRETTLQDAANAVIKMQSRPLNFGPDSKLIFSVIRRGNSTGTANYNRIVLYQRYEYGSFPGTSQIQIGGSGSFGGPPDYIAANADSNAGLQLSPQPDLITVRGAMAYVTEIYTRHQLITPLNNFGLTVPTTLYSISYF